MHNRTREIVNAYTAAGADPDQAPAHARRFETEEDTGTYPVGTFDALDLAPAVWLIEAARALADYRHNQAAALARMAAHRLDNPPHPTH